MARSKPKPDTGALAKHYQEHKVQPIHLITEYDLNFCQGCVIKHVARHKEKLGREDLKKGLYYLLYDLGFPEDRIVDIVEEANLFQL